MVEETWVPNKADREAGRVPGFGATTMIINGGLECGAGEDARSANRQRHYRRYCKLFGLEPGARLDCAGMRQFDARGAANPAIYWAPEQSCKLVMMIIMMMMRMMMMMMMMMIMMMMMMTIVIRILITMTAMPARP